MKLHASLPDGTVSATSSPHIILKKEALEELMKTRDKELVIMDLALPRDVDPAVKEIRGVLLYDLDDLKCAVSGNQNKKKDYHADIHDKLIIFSSKKNIQGDSEINQINNKYFPMVLF